MASDGLTAPAYRPYDDQPFDVTHALVDLSRVSSSLPVDVCLLEEHTLQNVVVLPPLALTESNLSLCSVALIDFVTQLFHLVFAADLSLQTPGYLNTYSLFTVDYPLHLSQARMRPLLGQRMSALWNRIWFRITFILGLVLNLGMFTVGQPSTMAMIPVSFILAMTVFIMQMAAYDRYLLVALFGHFEYLYLISAVSVYFGCGIIEKFGEVYLEAEYRQVCKFCC